MKIPVFLARSQAYHSKKVDILRAADVMTPFAVSTADTLSLADEELLAGLVEELSETRGAPAIETLERQAAAHPSLAPYLRELFATMSMADAVAEESTILEWRGSDPQPAAANAVAPLPPGGFIPGVTPLPAEFDDYELL